MPGAEYLSGLHNPWAYSCDTPYDTLPEAHSQPLPQLYVQSRAERQSQAQKPSQSSNPSGTGRGRERGSSYHHLSEVLRSYLPTLPTSRKLPLAPGKGGLSSAKASVELRRAFDALDMGKEGRLEAADVEAVLGMAFGVDTSTAGESWADLKATCECADGRLMLSSLQAALKTGAIFAEVEKMQLFSGSASAPASSPSSTSAGAPATSSEGTGAVSPAPAPAAKEEAWRLEKKGALGPFRGLCHCISVFKKFDDDQNGLICARDLQLALKRLTGKAYSKMECKQFIQRVDGNYNNVIELAEFVTLVQMLKFEGVVCKQNLM